jgi:hypothetical protein
MAQCVSCPRHPVGLRLLSWSCIRQWSTMRIICQLNFHNSDYGKGRWERGSDFFQVADAHQQLEQILSLVCLPRQTIEFPKSGLKHVTNEQYDMIQTACASSIFTITFMLFWSVLLSDKLKETREQSEKYKSLRDKRRYNYMADRTGPPHKSTTAKLPYGQTKQAAFFKQRQMNVIVPDLISETTKLLQQQQSKQTTTKQDGC